MERKKYFKLLLGIVVFTALFLSTQSSTIVKSYYDLSVASENSKKFVKTKNKCTKCSCSGYWGYKHLNGRYEGNCSITDKWGHKCGHGPEKHGLKKWQFLWEYTNFNYISARNVIDVLKKGLFVKFVMMRLVGCFLLTLI